MKDYNYKEIETKWQKYWYNSDLFKAIDFDSKPKYYSLVEFPYPSGSGMHVGHIKAYIPMDVISRKRRMEGYNVLFPIGFDAFGLPTENYAIKTGIHPRKVTDLNIENFTNQIKKIGFSFDFSRVVDTTDEKYYKWTQFIFLKLFEKGLAYKSHTYVNYCPKCKVVLSNEDSQGGKCDRCGSDVIQKEKDVWFLKITDYSQSLLDGLENVNYPERVKQEQINWIGKSTGAEINFKIKQTNEDLTVFTTRPDTVYGVTFMVIAPEHEIIEKNKQLIKNYDELVNYKVESQKKTEFQRIQVNKNKTGVKIEGINAVNPVTGKEIPIYVADYVMMGYGTGAIMAVPAHDDRDFEFAKKFGIDIIQVVGGGEVSEAAFTDIATGTMVNSGILDGLSVEQAKEKIINYLEENKIGHKMVNYKMKDWAFNRQRYWGEPIPIIHCDKCGYVADNKLPLTLPYLEHFQPGENGESPLAGIKEYCECKCPVCGGPAHRETDTMPQWAGSSWYFLRYCDPNNDSEFASYEKMKYWLPVDWYNGGTEHVTRHMIYSRFWNNFLFDQGLVPVKEPYAKRSIVGLILGPDGEKMSKSRGNVIDPLNVVDEYGADTLRTYMLFLGEYDQPTPWSESGIKGVKRFLDRVATFDEKINDKSGYSEEVEGLIHKTIKEVSNDIETHKYNTAISKLMVLSNAYSKMESISKDDFMVFIKLLNPFAPHLCEELNEKVGNTESLVYAKWPTYDETKTIDNEVEIAVQVNGKLRGTFKIAKDSSKEEMEKMAFEIQTVKNHTEGKEIKKVIVVPNKIVNIVAI